ncbi:FAD-binding protein [Streptomyces sp. M10(2022)]
MQSPIDADAHETVSTAFLDELKSHIPAGRVLTGGPEYTRAVALFNAAVDVRPSVVVRCASTADVQAGVRASQPWSAALRAWRGHDFWGRAFRPGGLVLDLTEMRNVQVDVNHRYATVSGGALLRRRLGRRAGGPDRRHRNGGLRRHGRPHARRRVRPLLGQFGLAADNLLGAEIVLADGSRVNTDAEHHPDLFWALRGGGGNFGVVTSARIRLHPYRP